MLTISGLYLLFFKFKVLPWNKLSQRLSWSAEYDGFTESREAFITSIVWKW
jgi:hypothetical protein